MLGKTTQQFRFVGRIFSSQPGRCYPEGTPVVVGKPHTENPYDIRVHVRFPGGEETFTHPSNVTI